jgi:hypothetical protein
VSDQSLDVPGWTALAPPPEVRAERYFMYRAG